VTNRKIDNLLSPGRPPSSALARLVDRASRQDAWTDQFRALLPQDLASECRVANVRDRVLTVHINNAAWATRLRFLIPGLLDSLARLADFSTVSEICLRVVPNASDAIAPTGLDGYFRLPDGTTLRELASRVDDADLKGAILRLATHADMPPSDA
jgi:Dna[CI] antecedent, DciA